MATKFGIFIPQGWRGELAEIANPVAQYEAMTQVARTAEAEGYDSVWVFDHVHPVPPLRSATTFECWTIMATLARDTEHIRLGQMVTCAGFRSPALLAKIASTVDVASHGRLSLGLGAGWYENEWRAYGYGFPDAPERLRMLRETVEILHLMWTEDAPVFADTYHRIDKPMNEPKGVQRPHPPLWIGGGGERATLKIVQRQWRPGNDPAQARRPAPPLRCHWPR
jgi:F420-dependent oxidoreductase-like protein